MSRKWQYVHRQAAEQQKARAREIARKKAEEQAVRDWRAREALSGKPLTVREMIEEALKGKAVGVHGNFLLDMLRNCRDPVQTDHYKALCGQLQEIAPRLLTQDYLRPLWGICQYPWLRPLDDWRPKGKAAETMFRSLAAHLLVKYSLPQFLYSAFFIDRELPDTQAWHGNLKPLACRSRY
jgi:hypothetical protein